MYAEEQHAARRIERLIITEEKAFAHLEPIAKALHAANIGKLRGVVFEREQRIAAEQFVFGAQDFGNVGLGNHAVRDGFHRETARVRGGEPGEIAHEQVEGFIGGLHIAIAMLQAPFAGNIVDDAAQFIERGQRHAQIRDVRFEFLRHLQRVTDEHDCGIMLLIGQRDVLQLPHVDGVLQIRMEIEQHEETILAFVADVVEQLLRFEDRMVRLIAGVEGLQAFGDGPAVGFELKAAANLADHLDDLRFLVALDGDERRARANDGFQIAQRAFRQVRAGRGNF